MRSIDIADVALNIPSCQLIDRRASERERRVRRLTTINTSILHVVLATAEKTKVDEDHR